MRRTALAALVFSLAVPPAAAVAASVPELVPPASADALAQAASLGAADTAIEGLGGDTADLPTTAQQAVFGDGSEIAGVSRVYDPRAAFRVFEQVGFLWTQSLGLVFLGTWNPYGIARDGSIISGVDCRHVAFDGLDETPGAPRSGAYVIASDGATIVGYAASARDIAAMQWTAAAGRVAGDLPGGAAERRASDARGGHTAVDRRTTSGAPGAALAVIPEPAAGSLVALGVAGLAVRRRSA